MTHPLTTALRPRTLLVAALVVLAALALALSGGRTPVASAASCSYSAKEGRALGPSYVTSIQVTRTSCSTGKKIVKAFHSCRRTATGRCSRKVSRYTCSEKRGKTFQGQFSSKVTCKRGSARVVHTYSEFL